MFYRTTLGAGRRLWGASAAAAASTSMGLSLFGSADDSHKKAADLKQLHQVRVDVPKERTADGVLLSRRISSEADNNGSPLGALRLYQYQTCPFCCKVRAFLDYYGFSYEVVEVNPVTRSQLKAVSDYKKVPLLKCGDHELLTESTLLVSILATWLKRPEIQSLAEIKDWYPSVEDTDEAGKPQLRHPNQYFVMLGRPHESDEKLSLDKEEREWREWVDAHFIHLISPNVYRNWSEAVDTFQWFKLVGDWDRNFPAWERFLAVYVGAAAMWAIAGRLKKRHGIKDERKEMAAACDEWTRALNGRPFLGGGAPNLADLALYGAIRSFYGTATFKETVAERPIMEWYLRVHDAVQKHAGSGRLADRLQAKGAAAKK